MAGEMTDRDEMAALLSVSVAPHRDKWYVVLKQHDDHILIPVKTEAHGHEVVDALLAVFADALGDIGKVMDPRHRRPN
jgi:hypothetical protein